ncbi:SRPBCC domain-containing protein [Saccharopolyspora rhizosphaerae]|uniref:SRPBCC domain-containing protein n=1 Tax=Saccharopolyspora rhizosphaerae TaxID=2492662 RepID=A0A426K5D7_9PSEU|nr:SRPBCC domain-containing protein [Saccharopolyspora rhizosphaerae]RRO20622.1 SRPBCC domain-containing protein [Saccharopolyspora rhizosphaerae]
MTVLDVVTDAEELTVTVTAEFAAPVQRVWQVWADRRELARWWGPPDGSTTFEQHDFRPGGQARYRTTRPDGSESRGWWQISAIDEPHRLEFEDGVTVENGVRATCFGVTHVRITLEPAEGRTRMVLLSSFSSVDQLDQMVSAGVAEGLRRKVERIEAVLPA